MSGCEVTAEMGRVGSEKGREKEEVRTRGMREWGGGGQRGLRGGMGRGG